MASVSGHIFDKGYKVNHDRLCRSFCFLNRGTKSNEIDFVVYKYFHH
jgi:hypothetical protein